MAICGLRTLLLIVCVLQLIFTIQRQVFDFLGYMWLPIVANFVNILLIIFGSFGAVQYVIKYILAYAIWSFMWLTWNIFLICYYLNLGTLNRESGLLSLGTGSVSWWETNGWGCQPIWGEADGPGTWRPVKVDGCFLQWHVVELAQSAVAAVLTAIALPLAIMVASKSFKRNKSNMSDKGTLPRRPVYTVELSSAETNLSESSLKPMTPRRVKRRSGSRGAGSSVRRSRRSYRNAGYHSSMASLPRDSRPSRPTSAHSSYSNFHPARPASYHAERDTLSRSQEVYEPPPPPTESVAIRTNRYDTIRSTKGYDVAGPYNDPNRGYEQMKSYGNNTATYDNMNRGYEGGMGYDARADTVSPCDSPSYGASYGATGGYSNGEGVWEAPPPAPPYCARATPQAPGPPAYQLHGDNYNMGS